MKYATSIHATAAAAALLLAGAVPASALMQLRLSVGATSITVFDNSPSDSDPNLGFIDYDQAAVMNDLDSLGFNRLNVQTGRCFSCPAAMTMSLVTGGDDDLGVPLIVEAWDYDFILDDTVGWAGLQAASAVLPQGSSITLESFWSAANLPFAMENALGMPASFTGASSSEDTGSVFLAGITSSPFGITLKMEFLSSELGFDAQAQQNGQVVSAAVPLPLAAPLLVAGLGGIVLLGARRRIGEK